MCTVTFIPSKDRIYLTSNRDEKHWRTPAKHPIVHFGKTGKILYPEDGDAGGTWFAIHENGNALVFLNGGFVKHTPRPPYRKSRGLVLLDLVDTNDIAKSFDRADLSNIEPFTAVAWNHQNLYALRWDGAEKHRDRLPPDIPQIWSSVTLYDPEVITKRRNWFIKWLEDHPNPSQQEIIHFHRFTGDGDKANDLMMNRDGKVFTVSITSADINERVAAVEYMDVQRNEVHSHAIAFIQATTQA